MSTCYLCRGTEFTPRKGTVRDRTDLRVIECVTCGLVTLTSLDHIGSAHYETSGMHGHSTPPIEDWLRETEADDERRVQMLKSLLANKRVLDFGSGACGFVRKASLIAREIAAVEPERRVRDYWDDQFRIHSSLEDAGGDYDVITAFHVVEHLPDPRTTLCAIANRLAPQGMLVIEVPSASDALLTLYDCNAFQRFTYWSQHLFLFTAKTLEELVRQAGLRAVSVQQYQRYSVANHLYWLSRGAPGGHRRWHFLDSAELHRTYGAALAALGMCDTLIATVQRD